MPQPYQYTDAKGSLEYAEDETDMTSNNTKAQNFPQVDSTSDKDENGRTSSTPPVAKEDEAVRIAEAAEEVFWPSSLAVAGTAVPRT